jgi:hypothetical protein
MKLIEFTLLGAVVMLAHPKPAHTADSKIVFGLTNAPLGHAVLEDNTVTNLGPNGLDGVSIFLGEAEGGVFAYVDTTDYPEGGDYMLARAYGRLNGVPDQLLCTVRGRRITQLGGEGIYPVAVDFSPLGTSNLYAQLFVSKDRLVTEGPVELPEVVVRTDYNGYKVQRVNPFWRTPDGGVAVVLDFPGDTGFNFRIQAPDDSSVPFGTRLVLRAVNPTGTVDYVSRVDVVTGAGVDEHGNTGDGLSVFQMNEVRPVVFGRPHKALGTVAMQATSGRLVIVSAAGPAPGTLAPKDGVAIELTRAAKFEADLQPVELSAVGSELILDAIGRRTTLFTFGWDGFLLGSARLARNAAGLRLSGDFPPLGTNGQEIRVAVYASGELVGTSPYFDPGVPITLSGNPRVIRAGARANSQESFPALTLVLDTPSTFTIASDAGTNSFTGDEIRLESVGPIFLDFPLIEAFFATVEMVTLQASGVPALTITGEREVREPAPRLQIAYQDNRFVFQWPDANQIYYLENASLVEGPYYFAGPWANYTNKMATAVTEVLTNDTRFFRLVQVQTVP